MHNQLDLEVIPKIAKEIDKTNNFCDFLSEELH
jgi:hypothetical protein